MRELDGLPSKDVDFSIKCPHCEVHKSRSEFQSEEYLGRSTQNDAVQFCRCKECGNEYTVHEHRYLTTPIPQFVPVRVVKREKGMTVARLFDGKEE